MPKEVFIPHTFQAPIMSGPMMEHFARSSTFYPEPPVSMNREEVKASLVNFVDSMAPEINNFMERFRKNGTPESTVDFGIDLAGGHGGFFRDASTGIVLGGKTPQGDKKFWTSIVGIRNGTELDGYARFPFEERVKGRMNFPYHFPVIVQLQSHPYDFDLNDKSLDQTSEAGVAMKIIRGYKWERALVQLVIDWAAEAGIPAVYLLPAELNTWQDVPHDTDFRLRYDILAKRMGFKMQPNGLFGISPTS